jgi:hypothetical protein
MKPIRWIICVAVCAALAGCGGLGQVNQGQVVAYDRGSGVVTLISDSNYRDPANPRFDVLPPVTIRTPEDPAEMGPDPESGGLLLFDTHGGRALVFDAAAQSIRTVPIAVMSDESGVAPGDARVNGKTFPIVDRAAGSVTVYSPRSRRLVAFSIPPEYCALPDRAWNK